ncbi:hypothetical protein MKEN_00859000 [Mycena kentingensis (nom. inval.)]|nr:hypothetical protein MKEN_00859000 [Mycena kentingensis (nom. inval.)]
MTQVPFHPSMSLGIGFDSFLQQVGGRAVVLPPPQDAPKAATDGITIDQKVNSTEGFITSFIDLVHVLNISPASAIKRVVTPGDPLCALFNQFIQGDVHYLVRVAATRQYTVHPPPSGLSQTKILHGDCFVSGFVDGGEFTALISLKVSDASVANIDAAKRRLQLQLDDHALVTGDGVEMKVIVEWRCGGAFEAPPEGKWTPKSIRGRAASFPQEALTYPLRVGAMITKYETLHNLQPVCNEHDITIPEYTNANAYAASLLNEYIGYKELLREIEQLRTNVAAGKCALAAQPDNCELSALALEARTYNAELASAEIRRLVNELKPYAPSEIGLDDARRGCEAEMARIVNEILAWRRLLVGGLTSPPAVFRLLLPRATEIEDQRAESVAAQRIDELVLRCAELEAAVVSSNTYTGWCPVPLGTPIRFLSVLSGKCMDYDFWHGDPVESRRFHQYTPLDNPNQKFEIVGGGPLGYAIRHCRSGEYVALGQTIGFLGYPCLEMGRVPIAVRFKSVGMSDGKEKVMMYFTSQDGTDRTVNVEGGRKTDGIRIIGYTGDKGLSDTWRVQPFEDLSSHGLW